MTKAWSGLFANARTRAEVVAATMANCAHEYTSICPNPICTPRRRRRSPTCARLTSPPRTSSTGFDRKVHHLFRYFRHVPVYCVLQTWQNFRISHRQHMWPVARTIFAIFFAHSTQRRDRTMRCRNRAPPPLVARRQRDHVRGFFIVSTIASRLSRYADAMMADRYISLRPCCCRHSLCRRRAATSPAAMPTGDSNRRFTAPTGCGWRWAGSGGPWH